MDKSYVTLEQQVCVVCGKTFDTNSLLLDTHMKPVFDRHTVTGWGLCPEHEEKHKEGYIALVCIDHEKSKAPYTPASVYRTGTVVHVRRHAARKIFNGISDENLERPMAFCDEDVVEMLRGLQVDSEEALQEQGVSNGDNDSLEH
jgi:hypothetical protein